MTAATIPAHADLSGPLLRMLGRVEHGPTFDAMRAFTEARTPDTLDELWLCEHPPVFTQGVAGRPEHVLGAGSIPVVATNRGGQVTFHGPGQVVAYPLIDLRRLGIFVKEYVYRVEEAAIRTLGEFGVTGHRVAGAPGIYVRLDDPFSHAALNEPRAPGQEFRNLGKIAALGIKVSRHCSYHGVALNVDMDLEPYQRINPCGYSGLQTIDLAYCGIRTSWQEAADRLGNALARRLGS